MSCIKVSQLFFIIIINNNKKFNYLLINKKAYKQNYYSLHCQIMHKSTFHQLYKYFRHQIGTNYHNFL